MAKRWGAWDRIDGVEPLGTGGNANVYIAQRGQQRAAIKVLRSVNNDPKRTTRFRDEIAAMKSCGDIPGVMAVIDHYPLENKNEAPWFAMPVARCLADVNKMRALDVNSAVRAFTDFANALSAMHDRGVYHRDLKPENLFDVQGVWTVGDFGLIDFPGKANLTAEGEKIGSAHYVPPEMLAMAPTAFGGTADVYALAKALWVTASGQRFPLPGEYRTDLAVFRLEEYASGGHRLRLLDRLLEICTRADPARRPTMREVAAELCSWLRPGLANEAAPPLNLSEATLAQLAAAHAASIEASSKRESLNRQRLEATLRIIDMAGNRFVVMRDALRQAHFDPAEAQASAYEWSLRASLPTAVERNRVGLGCSLRVIDVVPADPERLQVVYELTFNRWQAGETAVTRFDFGVEKIVFGTPAEQAKTLSLLQRMNEGFEKLVAHTVRNWRP